MVKKKKQTQSLFALLILQNMRANKGKWEETLLFLTCVRYLAPLLCIISIYTEMLLKTENFKKKQSNTAFPGKVI